MASKKILIQVDVTTKSAEVQINKVVDSMNKLEGATAKFADTTKKSRAQSGLNNAILIESGRFASDLRFGFTAVANNLGRIIELGQEFSRTEGGGLIPALRRIISFQGLFLIGFQLLVAYGDKVFAFLKGLVTETNQVSDIFEKASKNVSDINGKFEIYIRTLQDSSKSDKEKNLALKRLNEEFPDFIRQLDDSGVSIEDVKNKTEEATKQTNLYRESILNLAIARAATDKVEELSSEKLDILIKRREKLVELGLKDEDSAKERLKQLDKEIGGRKMADNLGDRELRRKIEERRDIQNALTLKERQLKKLDEEINLLIEYTKIKKQSSDAAETENEYIKTRIGNVDAEQRAIKDIGRLRQKYFKENQDFEVEQLTSERDRIELRRTQALAELDAINASEGLKLQARFEINKFYNNLIIEDEERVAEARKAIQLGIVSTYAKALGSLSQLLGKNTKAGKIAALAEIAAGTAVGFIQGLDIAQKQAKEGPFPALAFPIFYASQVAAVLGAAAQAKQVLESGGRTSASRPTAGTTAPSITTEAPDFNVVGIGGVSQLGQIIGAQFGQPLRAYVVSSDVRTGQALERNITGNAKLG